MGMSVREMRERWRAVMSARYCQVCGESLRGRNYGAITCGSKCRQKMYRLRHGQETWGREASKEQSSEERMTAAGRKELQ